MRTLTPRLFQIRLSNGKGYGSAFSRHEMPEVCIIFRPQEEIEGAGKAGCALHPRSRVQDAQTKTHTSIQVQRRQSGLPCAMVYDLLRALPGEPSSFATVTSQIISTKLSASVGRQDHTTSPSA